MKQFTNDQEELAYLRTARRSMIMATRLWVIVTGVALGSIAYVWYAFEENAVSLRYLKTRVDSVTAISYLSQRVNSIPPRPYIVERGKGTTFHVWQPEGQTFSMHVDSSYLVEMNGIMIVHDTTIDLGHGVTLTGTPDTQRIK